METLSEQERWIIVNDKLLAISEKLIAQLEEVVNNLPTFRYFLGYLRKATSTLQGIQLLTKKGLFEEAQILTRTIFELRATFDCFLAMCHQDFKNAIQRVVDAMMLEKIKQLKSVNYHAGEIGEELINRDAWEQIENEISKRYSEKELYAIRKYGFSGKSVESRCSEAGHEVVYNLIYRNFSRNVHSSDYIEHIGDELVRPELFADYLESRNIAMLYAAHCSAYGVIAQINFLVKAPFNSELEEIGDEQSSLRGCS